MGGIRLELVGCLVLAWFIVFLALIKGVKSLGKAVYFTAIFPYLILTVLLCFGLSLDGAMAGILYYVTPRLDRLTDVQVCILQNHPLLFWCFDISHSILFIIFRFGQMLRCRFSSRWVPVGDP